SVTAGATPAQSPTLPSRMTVAAQASPLAASSSTKMKVPACSGWRRRHHQASPRRASASGGTSHGDSGTGAAGAGAAAGARGTGEGVGAARRAAPAEGTATPRRVAGGGRRERGIEDSTTALALLPLPKPTGHPEES